jgi:hypothetical protein
VKKLTLLLIICTLLFSCATIKNLTEPSEWRTIKLWNVADNDPTDYYEFKVPGWMPDFYEDLEDYCYAGAIGMGLVALYCPDRDTSEGQKAKFYNAVFFSMSPHVKDTMAIALDYRDETVTPSERQCWAYVDENGKAFEDGLPHEVDLETFDCLLNTWAGVPCEKAEEAAPKSGISL